MKIFYKNLFSILSIVLTSSSAIELDKASLHGYGTLGVAYQDNENILYRNSLNAKKGTQGDVSFANYSSFGLQLDVPLTEKLSLIAQGVASERNSNGKLMELGWLNAKYKLDDSLFIRAGKMRLGAFMYSDILDVGYSYDWIRLPDMYSIMPINNYTGIELNHDIEIDRFSIMSTLLYGQSKSVTYAHSDKDEIVESDVAVNQIYGLSIKLLYDDLTVRAAYGNVELSLNNKDLNGILSTLESYGNPLISQVINKYQVKDALVEYVAFGGRYDFEKAYLGAEYIAFNSNTFMADHTSWYVSAGYLFDSWSPYILYSEVASTRNYKNIPIQEGTPALIAGEINGVNQIFNAISESVTNIELKTLSLGLRYNLSDNSVLKLQYDRQKELSKNSLSFHSKGNKESDLDIFSAAISFVF